ncbi:hypothetical protein BC938DRAFT_473791 [Jimgerdemannia flammicorona]|uniref:EF-hand domain-containing protein n=1 Tax=Jimgerdemannia flammicorona TaxID=994334 RepID=A0A433Q3G3_9FUNG|nr:hypothetical protein BC938DRAFT_473791 [Jimgerdemannia flammicorona]
MSYQPYGTPAQQYQPRPGQQSGGFQQPPQGQYGAPPPPQYGGGTPHVQYNTSQGYGAPPPQQQYGGYTPGPQYAQAPGAQAPPGADPQLWYWFKAVDTDGSGSLTSDELGRALINGDWSPFNSETVRLMMNMFDSDNSGTINFNEFAGLWKYIEDWKKCFQTFDADGSGTINFQELKTALRTFGYNLSDNFIRLLIKKYDKYGEFLSILALFLRYESFRTPPVTSIPLFGTRPRPSQQIPPPPKITPTFNTLLPRDSRVPNGRSFSNQWATYTFAHTLSSRLCFQAGSKNPTGNQDVTFDNFVQICVTVKTLTDSFRRFDTDSDGWIQISYEQFLELVVNNR